ncbi:MAG: MFS transporter [Rhodopila sp.]
MSGRTDLAPQFVSSRSEPQNPAIFSASEAQWWESWVKQTASGLSAAIFKRKYLFNTLTGCLWMAANFCVYYSIWAMLGTYLQKELHWTPAQVSVPVFWGNIITFVASAFWGAMSEKIGRRWALMIQPSSPSSSRRSISQPPIQCCSWSCSY